MRDSRTVRAPERRPTPPAAAVHGREIVETATGPAIAGELVVAVDAGLSDDALIDALAATGGDLIWRSPTSGFALVRYPDAAGAARGRASLPTVAGISAAYDNRVATGASTPRPIAELQWHLPALRVPAGAQASGIRVAVLDSGVAYEAWSDASGEYAQAPDLASVTFVEPWDFVNGDAHANDDHGHGTHIAATIAAAGEGLGVARGVEIMPIKVLDADNRGTELALAEGIRWAVDHGADVINLSLAFPPAYFPSRYLEDVIDYAAARGVVLVAASGNQAAESVSYPAAFRDVIAVGASKIWSGYRPAPGTLWPAVDTYLQRADYSNKGWRLDILAPGGSIDTDVDGDGNPEAILAQTLGVEPGTFRHLYWAGTSQATAEISGVVAQMLAVNPDLSTNQIRDILGDTARASMASTELSSTLGRGLVRMDAAIAAAQTVTGEQARYGVALRVAIADVSGTARGKATVEVLDAAGRPVANAIVHGAFTIGSSALVKGTTDASGVVTFTSPALTTTTLVGFQVDAVSTGSGSTRIIDRPHGLVRLDSCTLEVIADLQGIGTSPSATTPTEGADTGIGTSPSGATADAGPDDLIGIGTSPGGTGGAGAGIGTSPSATADAGPDDLIGIGTSPYSAEGSGIGTSPNPNPIPGPTQGIGTSPIAIELPRGTGERATVMLLNYSWSGATMPVAVAADAAWFATIAPTARVLVAAGHGIGTSPYSADLTSGAGATVPVPAGYPDACTPLVLQTYTPTNALDAIPPVAVAAASCGTPETCAASAATVGELWSFASGNGIGTSPVWLPSSGISQVQFTSLSSALGKYARSGGSLAATPTASIGAILDAAGIGWTTGGASNGASLGAGVSEPVDLIGIGTSPLPPGGVIVGPSSPGIDPESP